MVIKIRKLAEVLNDDDISQEMYKDILFNISNNLMETGLDIYNVRPENVVLADDGIFYINQIEEYKDYDYVAPEVYEGLKVEEASYVYSLGLIFYYLLNDAKLPFQQDTKKRSKQIAIQKRFENVPLPQSGIESIDRLFRKVLSFEVAGRCQSIMEFIEELEKIPLEDMRKKIVFEEQLQKAEVNTKPIPKKTIKRRKSSLKRKYKNLKRIKLKYVIPIVVVTVSITPLIVLISLSNNSKKINDDTEKIEVSEEVENNTQEEKKDSSDILLGEVSEEKDKVTNQNILGETEEVVVPEDSKAPEEVLQEESVEELVVNSEVHESQDTEETNVSEKMEETVSGDTSQIVVEDSVTEELATNDTSEETKETVTDNVVEEKQELIVENDVAPEKTDNLYMTVSQIGKIKKYISNYVSEINGAKCVGNLQAEANVVATTGRSKKNTHVYASITTSDINDLETIGNLLCMGFNYEKLLLSYENMAVGIDVQMRDTEYCISAGVVFE